MHYVTDLRHFDGIELEPDVPAPARNLYRYLRGIVRAATASSTQGMHQTAIRCRKYPRHRRCPGHLRVECQEITSRVEWSCPACGEGGSIDGWLEGEDDLTMLAGLDAEMVLRTVVMDEDAYAVLLEEDCLDDRIARIVYSAQPGRDGVMLSGDEKEFEALGEVAADRAVEEPSSTRRRRWRRIASCLEPRRSSRLERSTDVMAEELGLLGLVAPDADLARMIQKTLADLARGLRISEPAAWRYLDDERLRILAREAAFTLAEERPGADLHDQPRTIPVPAKLLGRIIAALAEATRITVLNADALRAEGALDLLSFFGQVLHEDGLRAPERILLPQAAVARSARLLEACASVIDAGGIVPPGIPTGRGSALAKAFLADATLLRSLVSEHGAGAGPPPGT